MNKKFKIAYGVLAVGLIAIGIWYLLNLIYKATDKSFFGQSETKAGSIKNDFFVTDYIPSKDTITLLDGREIIIRQVWAETMWYYHDRHPEKAENYGYNLQVEFTGSNDDFVFSFDLLDKNNQAFTNGMGHGKCILNPIQLYTSINIIVEEKNKQDTIGWMQPIITDTISLIRIAKK